MSIPQITPEQQQHIFRCINRWSWIRFMTMTPEEQQKESTTVTQVSADIDHSALLPRLIAGKKIFKYPPPRACSSPWYELLEEGESTRCNVHIHEEVKEGSWYQFPFANIEQSIWKIISKIDNTYICEYAFGHPWMVKIQQMTMEELEKVPEAWRTMKDWQDWHWRVTLLSEVEYMDF